MDPFKGTNQRGGYLPGKCSSFSLENPADTNCDQFVIEDQ